MTSKPVMEYEDVDFRKHGCEEFPGKRIIINGVHYEIGEYVGMGGSKICHALINIKARVSHHVINVYFGPYDRALEAAKYEVLQLARVKKIVGPAGAVTTPRTFYLESNGGVFLVQEYVCNGPPRRVSSPVQEIAAQSNELLQKDPVQAIDLLEMQRLLNPHDTIVLNNLAACFGLKDDWKKAFEYQSLVVDIEPHYCPFSYHYIRICGEMGLFTAALQENNRLRTLYPHPHDNDEEMLMILLSSGSPESAQEFLDEMFCESDQKRAQLQEAIHENRVAKERTRNVYDVVFNEIRNGRRETCLELIENAIKIYPHDYLLLANYAFFLRINEKYQDAAQLLVWLLRRAWGAAFYKHILANGIYCYLLGDEPKQAVPFLGMLYETVTARKPNGSEMEPWEFPGLAIFALQDGFMLEESPAMTIGILERAFPDVNSEQREYLQFFCARLRLAHDEASAGTIPRMLFQE